MRSTLTSIVDHVIFHVVNTGKGGALRSGFKVATSDIILVHDADLEYDPNEYPLLIDPILSGWRMSFLDRGSWMVDRVVYFPLMVGNKFMTFLSHMLTKLNLTDMETWCAIRDRTFPEAFNLGLSTTSKDLILMRIKL